jgi:hypothetical protein
MITIEAYIEKYYQQKSDCEIAQLFCTTAYRVERLRQSLRLHRDPGYRDAHLTLTDAERMAWYTGTFDPHECDWMFSGLTK